jgi:NAD binding domain of 6-phosphogluconate dehydrogenase
MSKDKVVGFVGLGTMGGRMAANLQKAGYKLVVHGLSRQTASHHLALPSYHPVTSRRVIANAVAWSGIIERCTRSAPSPACGGGRGGGDSHESWEGTMWRGPARAHTAQCASLIAPYALVATPPKNRLVVCGSQPVTRGDAKIDYRRYVWSSSGL